MRNTNNYNSSRTTAWRVVGSQLAAGTLLFFAGWGAKGMDFAASVAMGAGIGVTASLLMALLMFGLPFGRPAKARTAREIARGMYKGEALKFLVTIAGFILAFVLGDPHPGALFLGYGATFLMYWLALARV